jgi:hypothetical protein
MDGYADDLAAVTEACRRASRTRATASRPFLKPTSEDLKKFDIPTLVNNNGGMGVLVLGKGTNIVINQTFEKAYDELSDIAAKDGSNEYTAKLNQRRRCINN